MKPIPTPDELHRQWNATETGIQFAHSILAPMIEEARNAKQSEPWGEGYRLLVPGKDTWQEGDEVWDEKNRLWMLCDPSWGDFMGTVCGRRPLRNPWRKIADAPPEHMDKWCIVAGGILLPWVGTLNTSGRDRTHYMLVSDLPPVPPEPQGDKERERFEEWHEKATKGDAWELWQQAARKEAQP